MLLLNKGRSSVAKKKRDEVQQNLGVKLTNVWLIYVYGNKIKWLIASHPKKNQLK